MKLAHSLRLRTVVSLSLSLFMSLPVYAEGTIEAAPNQSDEWAGENSAAAKSKKAGEESTTSGAAGKSEASNTSNSSSTSTSPDNTNASAGSTSLNTSPGSSTSGSSSSSSSSNSAPAAAGSATGQSSTGSTQDPAQAAAGSASSVPSTGHSSSSSNTGVSSSQGEHPERSNSTQSAAVVHPLPSNQAIPRATTSSVPAKPVMLYGRIEELSAGTGATLPLKLTAMTPMRDTSLDKKTPKALSGAITQTFPMDFRGTWSGDLQVYSFNYDRTAWEFDREETMKEYQILKPGTKGRTTATFYQVGSKIALEPCQVIFQGTMSGQEVMSQMQNSPLAAMFGGGGANMMGAMQMPVMYALHLGDLTSGRGVTGNELNSQLVKNTLRQLAPNVVEQNVVTRDSDRNPKTGKVKQGYSENVVRFTRQSANQLYVQAATVSYRSDGKFQTKIILYGTLDRSSGGSYSNSPYGGLNPYGGASPFGASKGNPFGGAFPGGGAGGMGASMEAIQKMMQQMSGAAGR